ncbi:hypothetical protein DSLASN_46650 [Desulfoluna limicola]|uniref:Cyclic nucleotide-binding domain-containing protein n=2 Tax=Desulfoluna limicola TaxID=2810562 RepID=A0ABM7PNC4_9BACT|nr:hypothetical protein DSLASN_46650 [Desulfoluna limicola]
MGTSIKTNLITEETIRLLQKFQILKGLTLDEIRRLLGVKESDYQQRIAKLVHYKSGETVIREGDLDSWIFWIVKGSCAVTKNNIYIAEFNKAGEVFGEMSCLDIDSRSASVISTTDSICVSIDMSILDTLKNETIRNKIKSGIHTMQAQRLSDTTVKLAEERKHLLEQQDIILQREKEFKEKETMLRQWEKDLAIREQKLHDTTPGGDDPA